MMSDRVPAVSPRLRTATYVATTVVGAASILIQAVVGAWLPHYAEPVAETLAGLVSAMAFIGGALGVAYRPTRGDIGE